MIKIKIMINSEVELYLTREMNAAKILRRSTLDWLEFSLSWHSWSYLQLCIEQKTFCASKCLDSNQPCSKHLAKPILYNMR